MSDSQNINNSNDQNERKTSGTCGRFKRAIHGHVIPLIRDPGKAGLNSADSLDNPATHIPK